MVLYVFPKAADQIDPADHDQECCVGPVQPLQRQKPAARL